MHARGERDDCKHFISQQSRGQKVDRAPVIPAWPLPIGRGLAGTAHPIRHFACGENQHQHQRRGDLCAVEEMGEDCFCSANKRFKNLYHCQVVISAPHQPFRRPSESILTRFVLVISLSAWLKTVQEGVLVAESCKASRLRP